MGGGPAPAHHTGSHVPSRASPDLVQQQEGQAKAQEHSPREVGFTPVGAAVMVSHPKEEETHGRSQRGAEHSKQPDLPVTQP